MTATATFTKASSSSASGLFDTLAQMGHEQLVLCSDPSAGYRGIIAVHSTTLGPALGGTRFWSYANDEEAIIDALRLARGMTYKNAVAGLNLGGGERMQASRQGPNQFAWVGRAFGGDPKKAIDNRENVFDPMGHL